MAYSDLKQVERFARQNGSRKFKAHPQWICWAEQWIAKGEQTIVTDIENFHNARKVIKSMGQYCTSAVAGGNCVTIFFKVR